MVWVCTPSPKGIQQECLTLCTRPTSIPHYRPGAFPLCPCNPCAFSCPACIRSFPQKLLHASTRSQRSKAQRSGSTPAYKEWSAHTPLPHYLKATHTPMAPILHAHPALEQQPFHQGGRYSWHAHQGCKASTPVNYLEHTWHQYCLQNTPRFVWTIKEPSKYYLTRNLWSGMPSLYH